MVKLGGAVIRSPELPAWLDAIVECGAPIVIVPGGGALADEVREAQTRLGFSDQTAHRMALQTMDQLASAVAAMREGLRVVETGDALEEALSANHVAVWAPYAMVAHRTDIAASWAVTSDSLALWLAAQIGASACYVVKAAPRPPHATSAAELARSGVVDEAFPAYLRDAALPAFLLGPGDQDAFAAAVAEQGVAGAPIDFA